MRPDNRNPAGAQADGDPKTVLAGHSTNPSGPLDTDDLKAAAVVAFRTGNFVRVCDDVRCVDVVPDVLVTELVANGEQFLPTWLVIRATKQFPGRTAFVYDAGENRGVAA